MAVFFMLADVAIVGYDIVGVATAEIVAISNLLQLSATYCSYQLPFATMSYLLQQSANHYSYHLTSKYNYHLYIAVIT